jgi:hypothetical protein
VRFKRLVAACLAVLPSSCLLDWDSLRPDAGDASDAADEIIFNPLDAARDVAQSDAIDEGDGTVGVDSGLDAITDTGDEGTDASDASGDSSSLDASDAGADAADAADASNDADDASDATDASSCAYTFTGTLATYDFTGDPGNQTSTAASSSASGLTAGAIGRSSAITAALGANSINSSDWATTTTIDTTRYYTVTLTPPAQCALGLTSISVDTKVSSTGPADGAAATSNDSFVSTSTFTPGSITSVSLSVSGATTSVEIRIYGYDASSAAGTFRIENTMTIAGSLK